MTSYQNVSESQVPGYNDCPVLDYAKKPTSKPRRRIVSHSSALNLASQKAQSPQPPSIPNTNRLPTSNRPNPSSENVAKITETSISQGELLSEIESLLSKPSTLQDREFNHYSKKLQEAVKNGLSDSHRITAVNSIRDFRADELISFMLSNDGVSSWCLPLRKILENVKS